LLNLNIVYIDVLNIKYQRPSCISVTVKQKFQKTSCKDRSFEPMAIH